jgi:N-acyl-phosphatidylethanolamine-hydrolysing phospholipase D
MNPKEALQVHHDLESKKSIGMHWGTFRLTDEGQEDPCTELYSEIQKDLLPKDAFVILKSGQSLSLPWNLTFPTS